MVFPSKKDRWITVLLWGIAIIGLLIPIRTGNLLSVLLILPLIGLLLWFWFRTDYRIIGEKLKIRYGPVRQTINIKEIQVIFKAKKTPLAAAPALSLDRIVLHCGKFNVTSISPQDKQQFLQALVAINPHIKMEKSLKQSLS
ncbi:PH domain-containing protein [Virgibacillus pantothenticus]|uniref:PH domain-containing protein n=1 Tax=Virgibacillus pantothenticus TaxID=1473 RepID=UPI00147F5BC7|nr:PH domain-containing protein [Virgibacillus pantothenticus]